jgi:hypothetical protein
MISKLRKITNILYQIYDRKKFQIIEPKRNQRDKFIFVKDGFINYKISYNKNNIKCQCHNNRSIYCDHILYLLNYHFELNEKTICFLDKPELYEIFKNGLKNPKEFEIIMNYKIDEFLKNDECLICYYSLGDIKYNLDLFECQKCKNYVHTKCFEKWLSQKKNTEDEKGCVFCRGKIY